MTIMFSPSSNALLISGEGIDDGSSGDFEANLTYTASDNTTATLIVALQNLATTDAGGKITAFAFNNPSNMITSVTLNSTLFSFSTLLGGTNFQNGIAASPFGDFDISVGVGNSWLGGGNPNSGIFTSSTATFTFTLTGSGLLAKTEQSFVDELSNNPGGGGAQFFAVRYRGFNNGGSDKVTGTTSPNGGTPEPSTIVLFGVGLLGVLGISWRQRKKTV